jgi:outer membrane protein, heavy metal efflux system
MTWMRVTAVALAGALAGGQAAAQAPPGLEDAALAGFVQEALANNPDLRAARQLLEAARQRPRQASALPDPVVGLTYTNEGWSPSLGSMPDTSMGVMVSQDLPFPGKRRLRGQIAAKDADQAEQQLARARLGVVAAVRRAYYGLLQARALLELTREQSGLWQQIEGVTRTRYAVGQGNQQDVLRTQVELTRVGQGLAEQEAEAAVRAAELNRLLGRAAEEPFETTAALDSLPGPPSLDGELARLRSLSPELAAARLAVERAGLAVALARKEYRPDFTVQGGYMNRGGLDPMWQAAVGVNLPLRRGRRASALAEAEALREAAGSRVTATDLQLRLRTQERLAQLTAARKASELYREGIIPQDRMSVEAAMASYQAGRVPFITVLESLTTLYVDRATLVRLLAGGARIQASLDEASLEETSNLPAMAPGAAAGPGSMSSGGTSGGAMGSMSR